MGTFFGRTLQAKSSISIGRRTRWVKAKAKYLANLGRILTHKTCAVTGFVQVFGSPRFYQLRWALGYLCCLGHNTCFP